MTVPALTNWPINKLISGISCRILLAICMVLILSGCLVNRPADDLELPSIRLQIINATARPVFNAPISTIDDHGCVFINDESARLLVLFVDGGGFLTARISALSGEIIGSIGSEISIQPRGGDVRGVLDTLGADDVLTLQFADRSGSSLTGATVELSVADLPAYIHIEATDRNSNTQQFIDTIELRRLGSAAGGSCFGG